MRHWPTILSSNDANCWPIGMSKASLTLQFLKTSEFFIEALPPISKYCEIWLLILEIRVLSCLAFIARATVTETHRWWTVYWSTKRTNLHEILPKNWNSRRRQFSHLYLNTVVIWHCVVFSIRHPEESRSRTQTSVTLNLPSHVWTCQQQCAGICECQGRLCRSV